ncbi:MAG: cell division protein FtsQ/DivIB [Bacillota bacterium]
MTVVRWWVWFVALILLLASSFAAVSNSLFVVQKISVEGNSILTEQEVLKAAGLSTGVNLLAVVPHVVRKRLLGLAAVKDAKVQLVFPDTVRITLEERKRLALYNHNGAFYFIDDSGIVIEGAAKLEAGYPIVSYRGSNIPTVQLGEQPSSAVAGIRVLRALKAVESLLSEVSCDDEYELRAFLKGGVCLELGQADSSLEARCQTAVELIRDLKDLSTVKKIDVRYSRPVVTGVSK